MPKLIKITCKEANEICNKAQYNEASLYEKMKLNLHILTCKICALYSKQNNLLTKTYKSKAHACSLQKFELDDTQKDKLKEEFEELKKQLS